MSPTLARKSTRSGNRSSQSELRTRLLNQKTELVGELAQAIANQFNNIMMAITGYAELELMRANRPERHSLEQMLSHATQATSLIQKLLDFSRPHTSVPQPLVLDDAIAEISELLKALLGEHAELSLKLNASSEVIRADRIDVEQTVVSLLLIARNAMGGSGKLCLSTGTIELNKKFIGTHDKARPGEYVVLSLESDIAPGKSRSGLDQSLQVNLSLAAVHPIIDDCHGLVRFSSEPYAGTAFRLYLPVATKKTDEEPGRTQPRNPAVARTLLIVEDDDAVRIPAAEFLMMEGFKVLQAKTGNEALHVVQQGRSTLDILITDILMPKMSGHEVAVALLEHHPELKILYISGDPGRCLPNSTNGTPHATLRKPFRLNTLRDTIHDLLGE
jgi:two-component system, cell cycle sensor histidine kinase and response regulator CckA